MTIPGC
ncbi:unnamed protein product [Thlaspi arvense]|nr:unnamed protein product [Thlaspi arvense]